LKQIQSQEQEKELFSTRQQKNTGKQFKEIELFVFLIAMIVMIVSALEHFWERGGAPM
jgi:uncharacterized ion transporter superfamily protein YfcC